MEETIPTFEIDTTKDEYAVLKQIDDFEENIELINKLTKEYDDLKSKIKESMIKIGKENELSQVKWITPKGIQITCSIGHQPIFEKVTEERFEVEILKEKYPEIYKECCKEFTYDNCVKAKTNDVLRITLPK